MSQKLDDFTLGYIECALWATYDESNESGGDPLDENYDLSDLSEQCLEQIIQDCESFQEANSDDLLKSELNDSSAGHDFFLTRNGHGSGFWDRGLGEVGARLTANCEPLNRTTCVEPMPGGCLRKMRNSHL